MSDEVIRKQFQETLENPQYERWNDTSVAHILIGAMGVNGPEIRQLSLQLLENCCGYLRSKKWGFQVAFPDRTGLNKFTVNKICYLRDRVSSFPTESYTKLELFDLVYHQDTLEKFISDYSKQSRGFFSL